MNNSTLHVFQCSSSVLRGVLGITISIWIYLIIVSDLKIKLWMKCQGNCQFDPEASDEIILVLLVLLFIFFFLVLCEHFDMSIDIVFGFLSNVNDSVSLGTPVFRPLLRKWLFYLTDLNIVLTGINQFNQSISVLRNTIRSLYLL